MSFAAAAAGAAGAAAVAAARSQSTIFSSPALVAWNKRETEAGRESVKCCEGHCLDREREEASRIEREKITICWGAAREAEQNHYKLLLSITISICCRIPSFFGCGRVLCKWGLESPPNPREKKEEDVAAAKFP